MPTSPPAVEAGPPVHARGAARRVALWVLVVQCLLALSWTLYVLFLPGLLEQAHLDRSWLPTILIADQLIFAACDWLAGVYADRVALVWRRLGRVMTAVGLLSSALLLAMPWVATTGSSVALLATIFVWIATSSALRSPVFALLGRVREDATGTRRAGMVSIALVGISLAGAFGPYLTTLLRGLDPRLPLGLSALSLAAAGLWALHAEQLLPRPTVADESLATRSVARRRAWWLAAITFVAALGAQSITVLLAPPLLARFVGTDAVVWAAWFWAGFGIGLAPGTRLTTISHPFIGAAVALGVGAIAFFACAASGMFAFVVAGLIVAGCGWGVFATIAFTSAVTLSKGRALLRGAGTASGMLFSAFALAIVARLLFVSSGLGRAPWTVWLPLITWVVAAILLLIATRTVWRPWGEGDTLRDVSAGEASSPA